MAHPHRDPKGLALCVGFVLLLYWQAVSGTGVFFQRDIFLYWTPHIEWAARVLAKGELPQWNPFIGFGAPFMADPNFQFFYPPSILNWLLPAQTAYSVLVVGHSIFGGLGMFLLLRPRLRSRSAALIGALSFVAAGPIVSTVNLWHHSSSTMYMPWVVDAFLRLRSGRGSVGRLSFFTALQALAGSADVCVMTGLGLIVLLPVRARRLIRLIPKLGAAAILCVLLAAVQWLPAATLARHASRAALDSSARLHWSVSPSSLIDFLLPLGGAAHAVPTSPEFLEERLRLIPWMYLGASTLPLLLLGARTSPRLAVLLLGSIVLSLGRYTPLGEWAGSIPLVSVFRFPSKILWLVAACWAALAAIGFKELTGRRDETSRRGLGLGVSALALALALWGVGPLSGNDHKDWERTWKALPWAPLCFGAVLIAMSTGRRARSIVPWIVAFDLVATGQTYNSYSTGEMLKLRPTIVDELRRLEARRVFVFQKTRAESHSWKTPPSWTDEEAYYFGQGQFLLPPQAMRWSLKGSFDGDFSGLARRDYAALCALVGGGESLNPRWLKLGGVTHAIRFLGREPAELPAVAEVRTFHDRPVVILAVPDPLPLTYIVHKTRSEPSTEAAMVTLGGAGFDPAQEIVRVQPEIPRGAQGEISPGRSEARVEQDFDGRAVIRAHLGAPGTLVTLNGFSEGWKARVDGKPVAVQKANLLFQSVDLDAGEHVVELEYQTPGLLAGFWISTLAWIGLALALSGFGLAKKT